MSLWDVKRERENQERLSKHVPMTLDELKLYRQKASEIKEQLAEISKFVDELETKGIVDEFNGCDDEAILMTIPRSVHSFVDIVDHLDYAIEKAEEKNKE